VSVVNFAREQSLDDGETLPPGITVAIIRLEEAHNLALMAAEALPC
jgi:phosphoribosylcarboxyaminoimidazole (NCAIR) mutase